MADHLSDAELAHILRNREPYADALDLIAIRDELKAVDARLAELTASSVKRLTNRGKIADLQSRRGELGSAEIIAREHVRSSPTKSEIYDIQMRQRAAASPTPTPPAPPSARSEWLKREMAQRKRVPTLAGDDDNDE